MKSFGNKFEDFMCDCTVTTFTILDLFKKKCLVGTDINSESDNVLGFIIPYTKVIIYSCRYENKINLDDVYLKRYETEAYNETFKMTLPVFLSDWANFPPVMVHE